MTSCFFKR